MNRTNLKNQLQNILNTIVLPEWIRKEIVEEILEIFELQEKELWEEEKKKMMKIVYEKIDSGIKKGKIKKCRVL